MYDQDADDREYELGAQLGDPRRCHIHPNVVTSSNDGMFDAPCWMCESLMDADSEVPTLREAITLPGTAPAVLTNQSVRELLGSNPDDDIEF